MAEAKICKTCGTEYIKSDAGGICIICTDDRQFLPAEGQQWTSHNSLSADHRVQITKLSDHLYELTIAPVFAIGQRALLYLSKEGNVLWDCIPLLTSEVISFIKDNGGLKAIAFSHPHFFSNMNSWAEAFDCPIYINVRDKQWIVSPGDNIKYWNEDSYNISTDVQLIRLGGHFPGSAVLYITPDANRSSANFSNNFILSGDTVLISPDGKHISAMYSYPNRIPLPLKEVHRIFNQLLSLEFTSLYSSFPNLAITQNVKQILTSSLTKYV
jgi:hypothetical protein